MGWRTNDRAKRHALEMVRRGRVSNADWDVTEAERELLGDPPDWERYALWHLAHDPEADPETKAAYAYPYGDGEAVFRRAVASIKARAAQQGEDEIRAAADDIWDAIMEVDRAAPDRVVKLCSARLTAVDQEARRVSIVAATEDRDRAGDIIRIDGIDITNYLKNPVVLAGHGAIEGFPVIGKAVSVVKDGSRLLATVEFLPPGVNDLADRVFSVMKFLGTAAASVGILVREWKPLHDHGIEITRSELLEISLVPVPANQNALASVKGTGAANNDEVVARSLELANELVQELAALVTSLIDRLPPETGRKGAVVKIRRATNE